MEYQLIAALLIGILVIVLLVLRTRLDAFVALLIASLVTGLIAGAVPAAIVKSITTGFGNTLGSIGIVIGLGVAVGKILEVSGGADALAKLFLRAFGNGREPWAMASTGCLVSIPVFCDSGFVIMNPLARSIARAKKAGYVTLALALGCGMTLTHHLVPPTPGPLAVAGILGAELGMLIGIGLLMALILMPIVVIYAKYIGPKLEAHITAQVAADVYSQGRSDTATPTTAAPATTRRPTAVATEDILPGLDSPRVLPRPAIASLPLLVPLILIIANTVTTAVDRSSQGVLGPKDEYAPSAVAQFVSFIGNPVLALLIGLVLAVYVLIPRITPRKQIHSWLADAAASAGMILLITGAGGGLGQVLRDSGVGDALANYVAGFALPGVLIPFIIATVVRLAQGSGTVAMITAASVTAPLAGHLGASPIALTLACCAGSMVFSYYNDSYFWVVTRFTGLDGTAALKGWSGITTAAWAGSLPLVLAAGWLL